MARENADAKGRRYLLEGRLYVRLASPERIRAMCRGDGEVYRLGYEEAEGWWCSCPAVRRCSHLIALKLVSVRPGGWGA